MKDKDLILLFPDHCAAGWEALAAVPTTAAATSPFAAANGVDDNRSLWRSRRGDLEAEEAVDPEAEVKQRQEAQDGGGGCDNPTAAATTAAAASQMSNVPSGCDGLGRTGAPYQARLTQFLDYSKNRKGYFLTSFTMCYSILCENSTPFVV